MKGQGNAGCTESAPFKLVLKYGQDFVGKADIVAHVSVRQSRWKGPESWSISAE